MSKKMYNDLADCLNNWVRDDSTRALLFVEVGNVLKKHGKTFDLAKWHQARKEG